MQHTLKIVWLISGFWLSQLAFAEDTQMKEALVKIIHQLEAVKPLLNEAEQEQAPNPRIKLHFSPWLDANGVKHAGLRQDIETIQKALVRAVQADRREPRFYPPLQGDFIGENRV